MAGLSVTHPKAGAMWKHYIFCEVGQFFRTALVYESKYALRALIGHPTGFGGVVIFFCSFAFQPFHGNIVLRRNTVKLTLPTDKAGGFSVQPPQPAPARSYTVSTSV